MDACSSCDSMAELTAFCIESKVYPGIRRAHLLHYRCTVEQLEVVRVGMDRQHCNQSPSKGHDDATPTKEDGCVVRVVSHLEASDRENDEERTSDFCTVPQKLL